MRRRLRSCAVAAHSGRTSVHSFPLSSAMLQSRHLVSLPLLCARRLLPTPPEAVAVQLRLRAGGGPHHLWAGRGWHADCQGFNRWHAGHLWCLHHRPPAGVVGACGAALNTRLTSCLSACLAHPHSAASPVAQPPPLWLLVSLQWFTGPYVQRLTYRPDIDSVEVMTLNLLAQPRTVRFHVAEARPADTVHPLSSFSVSC